MSRIRINELARELEIKPGVILKMLPEIGITGKKTHSSSIEQEDADKVRQYFARQQESEEAPAPEPQPPPATAAVKEPEPAPPPAPAAAQRPAVEERPAAAAVEELPKAPPAEARKPVVPPIGVPRPKRAPQPIRPPLATGKPQPAPAAPRPAPPPAARPAAKAPAPPAAPKKPAPAVRPPEPGQILTGPRQPLPAGVEAGPRIQPGQPVKPAVPGPAPAAKPSIPQPPAPPKPPEKPAGPVVGQPAARPVVPPRPDLAARIRQQQEQQKMPGQPQPRRPVPGQPIYGGPVRPGQPMARTRGVAPGRPRRGPHPTAATAAPPPVATPGRRHQAKPARGKERERERDREGTLKGPAPRRRAAVVAVHKEITISEGITVKELAEKLGLKASDVMKRLIERKVFATINQTLEEKLAREVAESFGAKVTQVSFEEEAVQVAEEAVDEAALVPRPPVVTVMGHVDHGKTSLLDAIRESRVAEREAGGITQHIGAYQVEHDGHKIVFIDTPGHEAFTRMRARGAKVTDIVVLVVAADDGVMPQTLEALDHAKAAGVPIIVAINKIDRPDADPQRVMQQLSDRGLMPEAWGGDTVMVPVSAKTKQGLDLLLEMIILTAEMRELKANPDRPGVATVLEAKLDRGRGPVATVLVRNGTLKVGDYFICGSVYGKVRALYDDRGQQVKAAGPSTPVEVLGLESLPEVGETFQVVTDTAKAKQVVMYRETKARELEMARSSRLTLDRLHERLREGEVKELNIILKADVGGTAEVITEAIEKLSTDKVKVQVIRSGVGAITESDVLLATASDAIIVGFNVRPERSAAELAEREKIDIRLHTVIYELTDEIKRAMAGLLEPVYKEVFQGRAEVREIFRISKVGTVAGCYVQEGFIRRDSQVRLLRDNVVVYTGKVASLKRFKDDASEVKAGFECGVALENFNDIKPGDVIEAFVTERVAAEVVA